MACEELQGMHFMKSNLIFLIIRALNQPYLFLCSGLFFFNTFFGGKPSGSCLLCQIFRYVVGDMYLGALFFLTNWHLRFISKKILYTFQKIKCFVGIFLLLPTVL